MTHRANQPHQVWCWDSYFRVALVSQGIPPGLDVVPCFGGLSKRERRIVLKTRGLTRDPTIELTGALYFSPSNYPVISLKVYGTVVILITTVRTPIYPAEILQDELKAPGISGAELARLLKAPALENRVSEIMRNRRNIMADTTLWLGKWFGNSASFWMNLQKRYELRGAEQEIGNDIEQIQPRIAAAG